LIWSTDTGSWTRLTRPCQGRGTGITDAAGLVANGRIYAVWREHTYKDNERPLDVHFCRSDNGGANWNEPVTVGGLSTMQGSLSLVLASGPNGRLVIAQDVRDEGGFTGEVQLAISRDQGQTWPKIVRYSTGSLIDPAMAFTNDGTLVLAGSARSQDGVRPWVIHSRVAVE